MKRSPPLKRQTTLWLISVLVVISMVCSLVVVILPPREAPIPTPPTPTPAWTPTPSPTPDQGAVP